MVVETTELDTQKITITLPKAVLERLNELVPARRRSRFISEAVEERLALEEQALAVEEAAGTWSDDNHPEMLDDAAIDRWLDAVRSSWRRTGGMDHGGLSA
jgi:predicted transcriptional regulator